MFSSINKRKKKRKKVLNLSAAISKIALNLHALSTLKARKRSRAKCRQPETKSKKQKLLIKNSKFTCWTVLVSLAIVVTQVACHNHGLEVL